MGLLGEGYRGLLLLLITFPVELLTKKKFIDDCVGNRSLVQAISVDERMSGRLVGDGGGGAIVTGPRHAGTAVGWVED